MFQNGQYLKIEVGFCGYPHTRSSRGVVSHVQVNSKKVNIENQHLSYCFELMHPNKYKVHVKHAMSSLITVGQPHNIRPEAHRSKSFGRPRSSVRPC